jgi:hypothetical protein
MGCGYASLMVSHNIVLSMLYVLIPCSIQSRELIPKRDEGSAPVTRSNPRCGQEGGAQRRITATLRSGRSGEFPPLTLKA